MSRPVPAYRVPVEDRLRSRLVRREALDALARRDGVRVTVAPSDPHAPVTDRHTYYRKEES